MQVETTTRRPHMVHEGRNPFWTRTVAAARSDGGWVRVPRLYTRASAAQLTSDICNAHRRVGETFRVRGIRVDERWAARWETTAEGSQCDHVVWVRLVAGPKDDG